MNRLCYKFSVGKKFIPVVYFANWQMCMQFGVENVHTWLKGFTEGCRRLHNGAYKKSRELDFYFAEASIFFKNLYTMMRLIIPK